MPFSGSFFSVLYALMQLWAETWTVKLQFGPQEGTCAQGLCSFQGIYEADVPSAGTFLLFPKAYHVRGTWRQHGHTML